MILKIHDRDAGFSIYYMGVNTGSFLGQTVCVWLPCQASKCSRASWQTLELLPKMPGISGSLPRLLGMFLGSGGLHRSWQADG